MATFYKIVNSVLLLLSVFLVYQMYNAIITEKNAGHIFFYLILLVLSVLSITLTFPFRS